MIDNQRNGDPKTTVGLVQINNSFSGQSYLPYSVAMLQGYINQHSKNPSQFDFLLPIFSRINVDEAVEQLSDASVVMFSVYVWNARISLEIAKRLKAKDPSKTVLFGGPQIPDNSEAFQRENPFVDICVHGEGEQVTLDLLEKIHSEEWKNVSGISYLDKDLQFINRPKGARIKDINVIPSPFLSGIFEPLMRKNPNQQWIALWETNRGCPFSCSFCDWGSSTQSRVYQFSLDRIYQEIKWFSDHHIDFVFCCDANFGILPRDLEIAQFIADVKGKTNFPKALSVQNTKNATERAYQVQKTLSDAGLNKGVTLSMQSVDKETLKNIKRDNISLDSYQELQRRFTRDKVETYSDLILGLPGETYDSFAEGVSKIMHNGQHNRIQFNNLSILPNAEMGNPEYQKKYGIVTIESDIINIHGSLTDSEHLILEKQQLVIATGSMPHEDWVRTRAYCWTAGLLHFDKVLQIPLILTQTLTGVPYREIIETFTKTDLSRYPTLNEIKNFFINKARDIQNGGAEYCLSKEHLNIFWPADEYILIELIVNQKIQNFYSEALLLLKEAFKDKLNSQREDSAQILESGIELNRSLLKLPFQTEDLTVPLPYNIWEFYRGVLLGQEVPLEKKALTYKIDRTSTSWWTLDDFCREVIWYGNKKGAYLYTNNVVEPQIAGIY